MGAKFYGAMQSGPECKFRIKDAFWAGNLNFRTNGVFYKDVPYRKALILVSVNTRVVHINIEINKIKKKSAEIKLCISGQSCSSDYFKQLNLKIFFASEFTLDLDLEQFSLIVLGWLYLLFLRTEFLNKVLLRQLLELFKKYFYPCRPCWFILPRILDL